LAINERREDFIDDVPRRAQALSRGRRAAEQPIVPLDDSHDRRSFHCGVGPLSARPGRPGPAAAYRGVFPNALLHSAERSDDRLQYFEALEAATAGRDATPFGRFVLGYVVRAVDSV
jgi:hypothetical protein